VNNLTLWIFCGVLFIGALGVIYVTTVQRQAKPREVICEELAAIPHEPGALSEFLGPKYLYEYPHSTVLDCLWVELHEVKE